jgi:hypothetical protein
MTGNKGAVATIEVSSVDKNERRSDGGVVNSRGKWQCYYSAMYLKRPK